MDTDRLFSELALGDRRSVGPSNQIASLASADEALFADLVPGMADPREIPAMRCADAVEKASAMNPAFS